MTSFDLRAKAMTEYLQMEVGKDTRRDIEYSGYIKAVMDLLLITLDDIKES
jgi:hypothetical protein